MLCAGKSTIYIIDDLDIDTANWGYEKSAWQGGCATSRLMIAVANDVVSMDDEATFGKVLHTLSFGEAIEQKLLTDYQVVIVGIDSPSYESMITERALVKTDTDIESDAQSLASHIGLAKAMKNYNLRRIISFHSRVKSSRDFANDLPKVIEWMPESNRPDGELITSYVSGAMPTNQRNQSLQNT